MHKGRLDVKCIWTIQLDGDFQPHAAQWADVWSWWSYLPHNAMDDKRKCGEQTQLLMAGSSVVIMKWQTIPSGETVTHVCALSILAAGVCACQICKQWERFRVAVQCAIRCNVNNILSNTYFPASVDAWSTTPTMHIQWTTSTAWPRLAAIIWSFAWIPFEYRHRPQTHRSGKGQAGEMAEE